MSLKSGSAAAHPEQAASKVRVAWVDHSKGFCILMVVLLHAFTEMTDLLGGGGWVTPVVAFAKPFRMPDFFMIAGLFLANVIDRPWREYLDRKVWHFLYFYLLWTAIHFVLFGIKTALNESGGDWHAVLPAYLLTFIQPNSSLWFVHSLAAFFLVVRITRRVPWPVIWVVAAGLQMLDPNTGWLAIDQFCKRFVYFYSGYQAAKLIFGFADWANAHRQAALAYLLAWALLNQWLVVTGWAGKPGISLVLGYLGAAAVVVFAVLLSAYSWTGGLAYLGRNSIVLYLTDYVIQRVVFKLHFTSLPLDLGTMTILLTVISVVGSLIALQVATRTGMTFLYWRPAWSRLTRGSARDAADRPAAA